VKLNGVLVFVGVLAIAAPRASLATAHYLAAIGAEVEVLTRDPDLAVIDPLEDTSVMQPDPGPGVTFVYDHAADGIPIFQTAFVRAMSEGTASWIGSGDPANASGLARAQVVFGLVNNRDTAMEVGIRVNIPGRRFPELTLNDYRDEGSVDLDPSEVASARYGVRIAVDDPITGIPDGDTYVFLAQRSTRDDGVGTLFNAVGVPFHQDYTLTVPPSFVVMGSTIEIRVYNLYVIVFAAGQAISAYSGSASMPLTAVPDIPGDPNEPLPEVDRATAAAVPATGGLALGLLALSVAAAGAAGLWRRTGW